MQDILCRSFLPLLLLLLSKGIGGNFLLLSHSIQVRMKKKKKISQPGGRRRAASMLMHRRCSLCLSLMNRWEFSSGMSIVGKILRIETRRPTWGYTHIYMRTSDIFLRRTDSFLLFRVCQRITTRERERRIRAIEKGDVFLSLSASIFLFLLFLFPLWSEICVYTDRDRHI